MSLTTLSSVRPISREAALRLIRCSDDDLPELLAAARAAKECFKPGVITYSRKVFLPLTNLCRDYCGYCTFRRDAGDPGAHTMTPEEVLAVARAGEKLGCTEALFSLGDKPELLFPEMRETLRDAPGVGLAAPQIGLPLQLAVIEDKAEYQATFSEAELCQRERKPVPFHVLVNPQLTLLSAPDVVFFEGCLSLAGFTAIVPRALRVAVDALNHAGETIHVEASGWYARILQHEIDHLRGTLYIDRMRSRSFSSLDNYNRHWKAKSHDELLREFGSLEAPAA